MSDQIIDTNERVEEIYDGKTRARIEYEARCREAERVRHEQGIAGNYRKLVEDPAKNLVSEQRNTFESAFVTEERTPAEQPYPVRETADMYAQNVRAEAPVAETPYVAPAPEVRPAMNRTEVGADNRARIEGYHRPPAPAGRQLFGGEVRGSYILGNLEEVSPFAKTAEVPLSEAVYAPAQEARRAPAAEETAAPAASVSEADDTMPSARTMRYFKPEVAERAQVATGVGFWAALSAKTKLALAAVSVAIVACLMIICINSAVLGSVQADIAGKRLQLDRLGSTYRQIEQRIEDVTDPDNIDSWAAEQGMTRN